MIGEIVGAALGAVLGAIADAVAAWRRDRALEQLGYAEAQRDQLRQDLAVSRAWSKALADRPRDRADLAGRLRDGSF